MAYDNVGDSENVAREMSRIASLAERLTQAERFLVAYLAESIARRPADAMRALLEAEKLAPASWIVNHSIQREALILNRPRLGIEAFERIPIHDRYHRYNAWRLDALARALHLVGDYERELLTVRRAQAFQPGLLTYLAGETRALAALGRVDEVVRVIDRSLASPASQGTPAGVMEYASLELRAHGHHAQAAHVASRAVAWLRARPSAEAERRPQRAARARFLYLAEQWQESYDEFAALAAEDPDSIEYAGHLGVLAARRGNTGEALRISETLSHHGTPALYGRHTYWRACIAALLGDLPGAVDLLREALREGLYMGEPLHQSPHLEPLRGFAPFVELTTPVD